MSEYAYLYFPTPAPQFVPGLIESILATGISVSHFGASDPPRKWGGDVAAMAQLVLDQPEQNKYAFFRDSKQKLYFSLQLFYDPRWEHSTLSLSCDIRGPIHTYANALSQRIDPYLCVQDTGGDGKGQEWFVLHERPDCPASLLSRIRRVQLPS